jgi:hypothetical protein
MAQTGRYPGPVDSRSFTLGLRDEVYSIPRHCCATGDYLFTLYALDTTLNLQSGVIKPEVVDAASGHVLAMGQLEGTYMLPQPAG